MKFNKFLFLPVFFSCVLFDVHAETPRTQKSIQTSIKTVIAEYKTTPAIRTLDAKVEAKYQATISAQTSGRVVKMKVDIGDYVKKGDILIRLRSASQQANYNAAEARHKRALADYARAKKLYTKRLYSKALLDKAAADYRSALSAYNHAKEEIERTIIRAPYHGIVVKRHIQAGETARVGQPLLTGLSLESLRVVVEVPQNMISAVRKYNTASVILGGRLHTITNIQLSPYADPNSHTFTAKAILPKGNFGIYPGTYIKINFHIGEQKNLLIPAQSVIRRSEVSAVYTVGANNEIVMRQVRTGRLLTAGMIEILSGLRKGDRVALDPVQATVLLKGNR